MTFENVLIYFYNRSLTRVSTSLIWSVRITDMTKAFSDLKFEFMMFSLFDSCSVSYIGIRDSADNFRGAQIKFLLLHSHSSFDIMEIDTMLQWQVGF
jgi:hypothetical protein